MVLAGVAAKAFCGQVGTIAQPITFNKNFESAALGKIEVVGEGRYRVFVEGQQDARGRNRLANWYYFRMNGVKGRDITLTLTDLVGEYNDKPGSVAMNADTIPVFSNDGATWQHFPTMAWDDAKKEATLTFRPERDSIWIAHVPPYPLSRLYRLMDDVNRTPAVRGEVIGKSVQGRDLHLITVTNPDVPDNDKKTVWLMARQHAWETGTSYALEGALRFIASDDPEARRLRDRVVFKFIPTMNPDSIANGRERFNANGYDPNRQWTEVDLRSKSSLENMPEIWYAKKAIFGHLDSGRSIDLMLNLHNTESGEYVETQVDDPAVRRRMDAFFTRMVDKTTFDPSTPQLRVSSMPSSTTNSLWAERRVPVMLMEQRIASGKKIGGRPTADVRLQFGAQLVRELSETVIE